MFVAKRIEALHGAGLGVVLDAGVHVLGEIPADFEVRFERRRRSRFRPLGRDRQIRIDRQVQPPLLALEDRPDLERLPVHVEAGLREGVLEAQADVKRELLEFREAESRANVPAGELRADAGHVRRRLDVEAGLEVLRPPVRDLERFVELPVVPVDAVLARRDRLVRIDLDLEQILRGGPRRHRQRAHDTRDA